MAERIQLRRRLREQRRAREAMLLDLGALVYELHRQGRRAPELLQQKAAELELVDAEVRDLEDVLAGLAPAGDHPEDAEDYPAGAAGEHGSYEEELAEDEHDEEEPHGFDEDDGLEDDGLDDDGLDDEELEDEDLASDATLDDEHLDGDATVEVDALDGAGEGEGRP